MAYSPTTPTFGSKGPAIDLEAHDYMTSPYGRESVPPVYTFSKKTFTDVKWDSSGTQSPPPVYLDSEEPDTLARYYFKFGFLFPFLWIAGAWILRSPLQVDPSLEWLPEQTEGEKMHIHQRYRDVERRWARRCLWAFITFIVLVIMVVAVVLGVVLGSKSS